MFSEVKAMKNLCISVFNRLPLKARQWIWFVLLWVLGFSSLTMISMFIKVIMSI